MANIVITGANRGIGLELVRHYVNNGDNVIAVCRSSSDELDEIADQVITDIDLVDQEAIAGLLPVIAQLTSNRVDVLINNAGIFQNETLTDMDFDSIQQQFEINALAPLHLTTVLLELMGEGSKIVNITSRMGSIADNGSGGHYGYRASKAALNAFGKSLAMDLKPKGIAVVQLHPGFVQTRMVGFNGDVTPAQAATGLAKRIDELTLESTGRFYHANGEALAW